MRAEAEIRTGIGVLVVLQLLATLGSMGLLLRMVPLFDAEFVRDTSTIEARDATLGALAVAGCPGTDAAQRYTSAIEAVESAAKGVDAQPLLERLSPEWRPAFQSLECLQF